MPKHIRLRMTAESVGFCKKVVNETKLTHVSLLTEALRQLDAMDQGKLVIRMQGVRDRACTHQARLSPGDGADAYLVIRLTSEQDIQLFEKVTKNIKPYAKPTMPVFLGVLYKEFVEQLANLERGGEA